MNRAERRAKAVRRVDVAPYWRRQVLRLAIEVHEQQLAMQPTTKDMREVLAYMREAVKAGRVISTAEEARQ